MSIQKTEQELIDHKECSIDKLNTFIDSLIHNDSIYDSSKADKLCYWIEDWIKFLDYEPNFNPSSLRRYKRGEIIKLHLGFNIGSEEGGLHYAVVLDKNNSVNNPVLTVVPLTSVKPGKDTNNLHNGELFLGNDLFTSMNAKVTSHSNFIKMTCENLKSEQATLRELLHKENLLSDQEFTNRINYISVKIAEQKDALVLVNKMKKEISKMKSGSIALVSQITTVSKLRIYDPKHRNDVLTGIKLSNEKLDLIDAELLKLYTNVKTADDQ